MKQVLIVAAFVCLLMVPSLARAACSGPAGEAGEMFYNGDHNVMQYCNGTDWIAMGGLSPAAGGGGIDWTDCEHKKSCREDGSATISCDAGQPYLVSHACAVLATGASEEFDCTLSGANSLFVDSPNATIGVCGSIKCCALQ